MTDLSNYANLQPNTEERANVPASTSVVVLSSKDEERRYITIFNNSDNGRLFIDIDNDPSVTDAMLVLEPGQVYMSEGLNSGGEYRGVWDVADGQANIREFK
jgi:hypothetical protein